MNLDEQDRNDTHLSAQLAGAVVDSINGNRIDSYIDSYDNALSTFRDSRHQIGINENDALRALQNTREAIGTPSTILGSLGTKHGEVAEHVEVGVHNARAIMDQAVTRASFDGVGRTDAVDYMVDGIGVQSKFINGANNSLQHVLNHAENYPNFTSGGGYYHIPNDQYEQIALIKAGQTDGLALNERSINAILRKIEQIESDTGLSFESVVRPGVSDYKDVQLGVVGNTIDQHEASITEQAGQQRADAESDLKKRLAQAEQQSGPSLREGMTAAASGALIGGFIGISQKVYQKHRDGKNLLKGDYDAKDWKEVGIQGAKGAATGTISAGLIYVLTNNLDIAAPFAASMTSATLGIAALIRQRIRGDIDDAQLVEDGIVLCAESAIYGISTTLGQTLIPIPVLGAFIGSLAGKVLVSLGKKMLGANHSAFIAEVEAYVQASRSRLEKHYQRALSELLQRFQQLNDLTEAAFRVDFNLEAQRLQASVDLAVAHGVPSDKIMRSVEDVDRFMMS